MIDPAWDADELAAIPPTSRRSASACVAGLSTHMHYDHVLWHPDLGDVPRWSTPGTVPRTVENRDEVVAPLVGDLPDDLVDLAARLTPDRRASCSSGAGRPRASTCTTRTRRTTSRSSCPTSACWSPATCSATSSCRCPTTTTPTSSTYRTGPGVARRRRTPLARARPRPRSVSERAGRALRRRPALPRRPRGPRHQRRPAHRARRHGRLHAQNLRAPRTARPPTRMSGRGLDVPGQGARERGADDLAAEAPLEHRACARGPGCPSVR